MATEGRRTTDAVAEELRDEPWRFAFVQAVRLLEAEAYRQAGGRPEQNPEDRVRFRSTLARSFPGAEISAIGRQADADGSERTGMEVTFLGLTGPLGVLPEHYLDLLYRQLRNRDTAMRDFFDLFNHRTISLFYRAWEKYRPLLGYERALRDGENDDPMTRLLTCLVGLGTDGLSGRQVFDDALVLGYAGHFSRRPRSAWVLRSVLADHFGVPVRIEQFIGRWLDLEPEQRSRLPGRDLPAGQFNRLGTDTVLGARAWDEQGKFRLCLGPLDYATFERFLPGDGDDAAAFDALVGLTRLYVGIDLDFDVRLLLRGDQAPRLTLGRSREGRAYRLGHNAWLGKDPAQADRGEALFPVRLVG